MTSYSVLLTTGNRADCKGNGIAQAMKKLAKENPAIIQTMTATFITYINGIASIYAWHSTSASIKALNAIRAAQ